MLIRLKNFLMILHSTVLLILIYFFVQSFQTKQFHEAEISLSEANRINNHNSDVWGYLCLLNMTLGRYDEFAQCYAEMLKVNLHFVSVLI